MVERWFDKHRLPKPSGWFRLEGGNLAAQTDIGQMDPPGLKKQSLTVPLLDRDPEMARAKALLEPVREHVELSESFVIQGRRLDSIGGRRCGRAGIADAMTGADCAIRAT